MVENKVENFKPFCIYKDYAFTIEHTMFFDVPEYLIFFFNKDKPLHDQNPQILSNLGNILALTTLCIKEVTKTNYVYCLSFGEKVNIPHFHLFPRTLKIKKEYQSRHLNSKEEFISGPDLFAWIMKNKNRSYHHMEHISEKISNRFITLKGRYYKGVYSSNV